jgi:hypothetical protein
MLGGVVIGRLLSTASGDSGGHHGFELTLPPRIGAALTAAQIVDATLDRHRAVAELNRFAAASPEHDVHQ